MTLKTLKDNTIVKSAFKAVKYPVFALFVEFALGLLTKITEIQVFIPWLDELLLSGVLWTVGGFIFVYDVLKHGFGINLP